MRLLFLLLKGGRLAAGVVLLRPEIEIRLAFVRAGMVSGCLTANVLK